MTNDITYITIKQAAKTLGLSVTSFKKLLGTHIPYLQLKGLSKNAIRIKESDFMQYLNDCYEHTDAMKIYYSRRIVTKEIKSGRKETKRPQWLNEFKSKYIVGEA